MKRKIHNDDDQKDVISEVSDEEISEPAEPHMQPKQKKQRILHTDNQPSLDTAATNANNNNIQECPYLDTINRKLLDFDFEKICSVTLRSSNVYACLVCGRYFQGRSVNSPAYSHSINAEHHVFMNLQNGKAYCLPDGYEIIDPSLGDIKYNLDPSYSDQLIRELDTVARTAVAQTGDRFLPGVVGLNNLKLNDGVNAVVQALARVTPLRNFFLKKENVANVKSRTVLAFGELMRKLFNPRSFKTHVSPHELMQAVSEASNKRFRIGVHIDPLDFLAWFLNTINRDLQKNGSSIISDVFQGRVEMLSQQVKVKSGDEGEEEEEEQKDADEQGIDENEQKSRKQIQRTVPFMFLTVDIPTAPLFRDEHERNIIPQIPLYKLLSKFDGETVSVVPVRMGVVEKKLYRLKQLPTYLVIHVKRFTSNPFFKEKNPTIVSFPVRNLDLREYVSDEVSKQLPSTKYSLVANIRHEGKPDDGAYMVHILNRANAKWYDVCDLNIREASHQEVPISESYIMIYENESLGDK